MIGSTPAVADDDRDARCGPHTPVILTTHALVSPGGDAWPVRQTSV
ncbi:MULTISPECIES: hypothetical protein [unclassified Curtobacterium]|nr:MULTISPECIES: hypothetical protein [unclassified Curtobacterium]